MMPSRALLALGALFALGHAAEPEHGAAPTPPPKVDAAAEAAAAQSSIQTGPGLGWVFPLYTDKEGYHDLTLRGTGARAISANEIEVTGFSAVRFAGDATERVDTVLLSPQATFYPKENRAAGNSAVRLIHDDVEITGERWTYDGKTKKVSLAHNVHVTFNSQIKDILK